MGDPIFWLGLSILLVAVSLTAVLVVALPALRELARAARSAEKLFDTLSRELPPTLEAIRLTGMEISDLTDEMSDGVQSASRVVKQVDRSLKTAKKQAKKAQVTTRSLVVGFRAAWRAFNRPPSPSPPPEQLPAGDRPPVDYSYEQRKGSSRPDNRQPDNRQSSPYDSDRSYAYSQDDDDDDEGYYAYDGSDRQGSYGASSASSASSASESQASRHRSDRPHDSSRTTQSSLNPSAEDSDRD